MLVIEFKQEDMFEIDSSYLSYWCALLRGLTMVFPSISDLHLCQKRSS